MSKELWFDIEEEEPRFESDFDIIFKSVEMKPYEDVELDPQEPVSIGIAGYAFTCELCRYV